MSTDFQSSGVQTIVEVKTKQKYQNASFQILNAYNIFAKPVIERYKLGNNLE